ncbi:phage minor capsid protein [Pseudoruminococcus massiliensis]|uniref:phage minor capsid protein n=1 Tax=Pseudoruminococcus massiliensis TaxID=2086583 RepID=UPI000D0E9FAD|nr:phage minor capsid protein [Pseudoruminococcus massiliensis]
MSDYDIGKAFEKIENELIASMIRNLSRHRAEESKLGIEWSQWQVEQLKALEVYKRKNSKRFTSQYNSINEHIRRALRDSYNDGGTKQERQILQAIKRGFKGKGKNKPAFTGVAETTGEFFKTNERKLNSLIKATTHDMEKAEIAVLRMANDRYRKIIFNAQVMANTGAGTYAKAVDMATKDFLSAGINCIEYRNGRRVNIKSYAEMALRTANKRAYLQGEGAKRQEWGIYTVILNKRGNPCPLCAPFVGRVFIDDVWSGGPKNGISPVTGVKYPLLSEAIKNGLYHPNCKDAHTTYFEGISTPPKNSQYTADELDELAERYNNAQKQNYAQNEAERMERMSKFSLDKDNKRAYGARAEQWREKAHSFSVSNNDKAQYYKPITETKEIERFIRKDKEITLHKTTSANDIYLSESVKIKRKAFHKFDTNISEVYKMLGEIDSVNKPKIYIISPDEMTSNAVASYQPIENILNINSVLFNTDSLVELQKDFACPDSEISTILHELIHWQDADKYKRKFGEITDFGKYIEYLNKKFAPKLEKLQKRGYNIFGISEYASNKLNEQIPRLDEVYTEYRVKKMIGG